MCHWLSRTITFAAFLSLSSCYVTRQAVYQNNLFNNRELISDVLRQGDLKPKERQQLVELQAILSYAGTQGLNAKGAYLYYIATDKPVVSYLVYAAFADRLESKTWWFPVVGRVPYLGFFKREAREAKLEELQEQGFDVHRSGVGAFSSLGWFEDPIYTSMLRRSRADFAHLIFHELTHRTYWSPGSVRFNENLAEYVGEVLTERYLKSRQADKEWQDYIGKRGDRKIFKNWLESLRQALNKLYKNPPPSREQLLAEKARLFELYTKGDQRVAFEERDYIGKKPWNNARVLANSLYSPDLDRFRRAHGCLKTDSLPEFFTALEDREGEHDDQFKVLDSLCTAGSY